MSVVYQTVVLYGWELPFGTIDPEITYDYNPRKVESSGQPVILSDGRGGEYEFVGTLISKTNSTRNGHQSFDSPLELDPESQMITNETEDLIESLNISVEEEPSIYVVTHIT